MFSKTANSRGIKMFRDVLMQIKKELLSYDDKDRTFKKSIEHKLNRSLRNYEDNIDRNAKYILSRNNYKVLRTIDRMEKRKQREKEKEEYEWRI